MGQRSLIRLITCGLGVRRGDLVDRYENKLEQTCGQGIGFSMWIIRFARAGQYSAKHIKRLSTSVAKYHASMSLSVAVEMYVFNNW